MWESLIKRHLGARLGIFMYLVIRVGYFEKIFTCIKGVLGCKKFGWKAAVSDSTQGLHWLENGQFGSLGTPHIGISGKMGRFGQPSLCIRDDIGHPIWDWG